MSVGNLSDIAPMDGRDLCEFTNTPLYQPTREQLLVQPPALQLGGGSAVCLFH